MKKQNVRTLALIVCAFTYLLIGAAIFDALESKNETDERISHEEEEETLKREFNITDENFERLRRIMLKSKYFKAGVQWKFSGSFYFALTVFTTIGYGHSTPKTFGGRTFCIAYALGGIPLGLVMFQSIGERLNIFITYMLCKIKRCVKAKRSSVSHAELIAVSCTLCGIVLAAGAAAFSHLENWRFEDAFYYCFITLATIGFGDYVALQEDQALQKRPEYVAFSVLYILFGLTVFAAALNLLVLHLLTMNTEDERKDELEALAVARSSAHLDGDVITPASAIAANGGGGGGSSNSSNGSDSAVATLLSNNYSPHVSPSAAIRSRCQLLCCCLKERGSGRGEQRTRKEVTFSPYQYAAGLSSSSQMARLLPLQNSEHSRDEDDVTRTQSDTEEQVQQEQQLLQQERERAEIILDMQQTCKRASV